MRICPSIDRSSVQSWAYSSNLQGVKGVSSTSPMSKSVSRYKTPITPSLSLSLSLLGFACGKDRERSNMCVDVCVCLLHWMLNGKERRFHVIFSSGALVGLVFSFCLYRSLSSTEWRMWWNGTSICLVSWWWYSAFFRYLIAVHGYIWTGVGLFQLAGWWWVVWTSALQPSGWDL